MSCFLIRVHTTTIPLNAPLCLEAIVPQAFICLRKRKFIWDAKWVRNQNELHLHQTFFGYFFKQSLHEGSFLITVKIFYLVLNKSAVGYKSHCNFFFQTHSPKKHCRREQRYLNSSTGDVDKWGGLYPWHCIPRHLPPLIRFFTGNSYIE